MNKFEKVSKYENDEDVKLPVRSTTYSAGYDFFAAEDAYVPPIASVARNKVDDSSKLATLISTGVKAKLDENRFLMITSRSSVPLKRLLICGNGVGIIDRDYYNNEDNEGEIFFQVFNLSNEGITIHKGEKICQGIILNFDVADAKILEEQRKGGFGSTDEKK